VRRVGERQLPASLGLRRRQPQTHKVPARRRRRVVSISRAAVQGVRVAEELDVADLEDHVQRQAHAGFFQHGGGVLLCLGEGRDDAGVAEARERFHVVGVPFAVDAGGLVGPGFFVEDGLAGVGFLADGDFAFAVEVPDGLGEGLGNVGVLFLEGVPDVVGGDDVGLAAFEGTVDAQQADDVAVVGVEELAGAGAVDADFVDLGWVGAGVFDVAEDVAQAVLRDEVAEVGAETHVGDG